MGTNKPRKVYLHAKPAEKRVNLPYSVFSLFTTLRMEIVPDSALSFKKDLSWNLNIKCRYNIFVVLSFIIL